MVLLLLITAGVMAERKYVLVIDAGHGGKDAGAVGTYLKEKDVNLRAALAFGQYVERNCPDVKVIYTRKKDVFLELYERADIANKNHADVFISIHTNSLPKGHYARGVETYSMTLRRSEEKLSAAQRENSVITFEKDYEQRYAGFDENSEESRIMYEIMNDENMKHSVELAKSIQTNICQMASRPNKGVKQDNFHVLRRTSMPACLVELGFISTPDEEAYLNTAEGIDRMAYGIFSGFVKYKSKNATIPPYQPVAQQEPTTMPTIVPQKVEQEEAKPVAKKRKAAARSEQAAPAEPAKPAESVAKEAANNDAPVFKVQFTISNVVLKEGSAALKGLTDVSYYKDGRAYKYTVGEFATFSEANRKRREINELFPGCFVVAFRDGMRIDLEEAKRWKGAK